MNHGPDDICGRCKHLTTKGYEEHMARGEGRCTGYDNQIRKPTNLIVAWNLKACTHYRRVWNDETRERWIAKHQAGQERQTETISQSN